MSCARQKAWQTTTLGRATKTKTARTSEEDLSLRNQRPPDGRDPAGFGWPHDKKESFALPLVIGASRSQQGLSTAVAAGVARHRTLWNAQFPKVQRRWCPSSWLKTIYRHSPCTKSLRYLRRNESMPARPPDAYRGTSRKGSSSTSIPLAVRRSQRPPVAARGVQSR
jgi:hypothetical protein